MSRLLAFLALTVLAQGCAALRPHHLQQGRAYRLSELTVEPRLPNPHEVRCEVLSLGPLALRFAGSGGAAVLDLTVDTHGHVVEVHLDRSSGKQSVDAAMLRIAPAMQFSPGRLGGAAVPARFTLPLSLAIEDMPATLPRPPGPAAFRDSCG